MLYVGKQGRRESRGGPGEAFAREARTNLLIIYMAWQLINALVRYVYMRASKNLCTLTRTVKALFYPSVHSLSADNAMEKEK